MWAFHHLALVAHVKNSYPSSVTTRVSQTSKVWACISAQRQDKNTSGARGVTHEPDGFPSDDLRPVYSLWSLTETEACERGDRLFLLYYYHCDCLCFYWVTFVGLYFTKHCIMLLLVNHSQLDKTTCCKSIQGYFPPSSRYDWLPPWVYSLIYLLIDTWACSLGQFTRPLLWSIIGMCEYTAELFDAVLIMQ